MLYKAEQTWHEHLQDVDGKLNFLTNSVGLHLVKNCVNYKNLGFKVANFVKRRKFRLLRAFQAMSHGDV